MIVFRPSTEQPAEISYNDTGKLLEGRIDPPACSMLEALKEDEENESEAENIEDSLSLHIKTEVSP